MKGQYEEGFALAARAIQFRPTQWSLGAYIINAVSLGHIDQAREAMKKVANNGSRLESFQICQNPILRDPDLNERIAGILRVAGMPE